MMITIPYLPPNSSDTVHSTQAYNTVHSTLLFRVGKYRKSWGFPTRNYFGLPSVQGSYLKNSNNDDSPVYHWLQLESESK